MPGGVFNRFPVAAVERARFIAAKRAGGYTNDEVQAMLDKMDAEEARKAKAAARPPAPAPATRRPSAPAKAALSARRPPPVAPGSGIRAYHPPPHVPTAASSTPRSPRWPTSWRPRA
jgi:DNA-binding transcriptional MerR regulator